MAGNRCCLGQSKQYQRSLTREIPCHGCSRPIWTGRLRLRRAMPSLYFLQQLDDALRERRVEDGMQLLQHAGSAWANPDVERWGAAIVLRTAQWLDVGHRDKKSLDTLLARFTPAIRARMPLVDYLQLRLAEAFQALSTEDPDVAIEALEFVLKAERDLGDDDLMVLTNFWKGRAHRKKGEYEAALKHVVEARCRAETSRSAILAAVIEVQEGWLIFQKGDARRALELFTHAEQILKSTDDAISLGNIESARGRI